LGALPILQLKELEVDQERYQAWKASLKQSGLGKKLRP
jgi:hypothetical protein